jgi:hypothetical protein
MIDTILPYFNLCFERDSIDIDIENRVITDKKSGRFVEIKDNEMYSYGVKLDLPVKYAFMDMLHLLARYIGHYTIENSTIIKLSDDAFSFDVIYLKEVFRNVKSDITFEDYEYDIGWLCGEEQLSHVIQRKLGDFNVFNHRKRIFKASNSFNNQFCEKVIECYLSLCDKYGDKISASPKDIRLAVNYGEDVTILIDPNGQYFTVNDAQIKTIDRYLFEKDILKFIDEFFLVFGFSPYIAHYENGWITLIFKIDKFTYIKNYIVSEGVFVDSRNTLKETKYYLDKASVTAHHP